MNKTSKLKRASQPLALAFVFILFWLLVSIPYAPADPPRPIMSALNERSSVGNQKNETSDKNVTLDFNNVDIRLVIKFMSDLLGKNFLVDDAVKGNVVIRPPDAGHCRCIAEITGK